MVSSDTTAMLPLFNLNLVAAIAGRPKPEIWFLPGQLKWKLLTKEHYSSSLSGRGSNTQHSMWKADILPLSYRRPMLHSSKTIAMLYWKEVLCSETLQMVSCVGHSNVPSYCCQRNVFLWLLPQHGSFSLSCRKVTAFYKRPFAMYHHHPEKDEQNSDIAHLWKISADAHDHYPNKLLRQVCLCKYMHQKRLYDAKCVVTARLYEKLSFSFCLTSPCWYITSFPTLQSCSKCSLTFVS